MQTCLFVSWRSGLVEEAAESEQESDTCPGRLRCVSARVICVVGSQLYKVVQWSTWCWSRVMRASVACVLKETPSAPKRSHSAHVLLAFWLIRLLTYLTRKYKCSRTVRSNRNNQIAFMVVMGKHVGLRLIPQKSQIDGFSRGAFSRLELVKNRSVEN